MSAFPWRLSCSTAWTRANGYNVAIAVLIGESHEPVAANRQNDRPGRTDRF